MVDRIINDIHGLVYIYFVWVYSYKYKQVYSEISVRRNIFLHLFRFVLLLVKAVEYVIKCGFACVISRETLETFRLSQILL